MRTQWSSTAAAIVAAGGFIYIPSIASAADTFYSGRATGINGEATILGTSQDVLVVDVAMSCQGLPHDETLASISNPIGVNAQNIKVHTLGRDGKSSADATMENFGLDVPGLKIQATAIGAHARVTCDAATGTANATGHSDFGTLTINGQAFDVKTKKRFDIPNVASIVFDEHRHYANEMKVNAIHVTLANPGAPASGEFYVGQVRAKATCNP